MVYYARNMKGNRRPFESTILRNLLSTSSPEGYLLNIPALLYTPTPVPLRPAAPTLLCFSASGQAQPRLGLSEKRPSAAPLSKEHPPFPSHSFLFLLLLGSVSPSFCLSVCSLSMYSVLCCAQGLLLQWERVRQPPEPRGPCTEVGRGKTAGRESL